MPSVKEKRKQFMSTLLTAINFLDPSGLNGKQYEAHLSNMTDEDFDKWAISFLNDENAQLYWEIEEFENDMDIRNIEKAAEFLNVPLFESVAIPYLNKDPENIVVTPQAVPVGYIHMKRMQQMLAKKNAGSTSIEQRNPKTGQVIGDDKNARNTDVETYSMFALGAEKGLAELMGPRADDQVSKNEMLNAIATNGFVYLEELTNLPENKISLRSLDVYFMLMGVKTNLVVGGDDLLRPRKSSRPNPSI